jgi:hypothetical protein
MGLLRHLTTRVEAPVRTRLTVGRSASCDLCLESRGVSNQHASIQWTGSSWSIRDLGSRNGTHVNGKLLLRAAFPLAPGDEIVFGDPLEKWGWVDGGSPVAAAMREGGARIEAKAGLLLLPDEACPVASVFVRGDVWQLEMAGAERPVLDEEWLEVNGERFRLLLPSPNPEADDTQTLIPQESILDATVSFYVSLDEEHVRIVIECRGRTEELPGHAYHYMLLLLGRKRLEDARNGLPEAESGWTYVDDLTRDLALDAERLNVHVLRARRAAAFAADRRASSERGEGTQGGQWFRDANALIQRRPGQIRLGVPNVVIGGEQASARERPP